MVNTEIQSVLLSRKKFDKRSGNAWLHQHDFNVGRVDVTQNMLRARQHAPGLYQPRSFRTIRLSPTVEAVIGKRRN